MKNTQQELIREVRRLANFLEGICILEGPQAKAFTAQQAAQILRARTLLRNLGVRIR